MKWLASALFMASSLVINAGDSPSAIARESDAAKRTDTCFRCLTETSRAPLPPSIPATKTSNVSASASSGSQEIRTFRLAVAAAGEYTEFHGGTVASASAAIAVVVARVNEIYLRELGVRLALIPQNNLVIFTNKQTDPFTDNGPSTTTVNEAQTTFDTLIGTANYDLGIVFNTGTYGLAYIRGLCDPQKKGSTCMGLPQPVGEQFNIYVAHELGHQLGANHTLNSSLGICAGNRNGPTAVEPGTGSTLMSYAGVPCANDSLQPLMSDYFHAASLAEIRTFLSSTFLCGTVTTTNNEPPSVTAPAQWSIPKLTPFRLTASGSDPDGDAIMYCWEEMDVGPAASLADPDNGLSPLFRSFPPTTNAARTFPQLSALLQNQSSLGERLPSTNRTLHFRVTVRDDRAVGAGGHVDTQVQAVNAAGPFRLLSHNTSSMVGGEGTVTWDPSGTTNAPISALSVNILLSTNGGQTFPIVLATNTPNDGAQLLTFPSINSSAARLKIEAVGNIFFDVNDTNFTITTLPYFTKIQATPGGVLLRWTRKSGKTYQLEGTTTLHPINWQTISVTQTPSGSEMQATVPFGAATVRYFRVREL